MSGSTRGIGSTIGALICLVTLVFSASWLRQGIAFMDEPHYVALPWRFVLGDEAYVDEHFPSQVSAVLETPLVRLFCALRGSSEGLVLFLRASYWVLSLLVGAAAFVALRPLTGTAIACTSGLVAVAWCPLGVPNLSYNTVPCSLFAIGLFLSVRTMIWDGGPAWLALAGIAHGVAAACQPSYVAAAAVHAVAVWLVADPTRRTRLTALYCACGLAVGAAFVPLLLRVDPETRANLFMHLRSTGGWGARTRFWLLQAWNFVPAKTAVGGYLAALGICLWWRPRAAAALLSVLPLFPLAFRRAGTSVWYVLLLGLAGLPFFFVLRRRTPVRQLFLLVGPASVLAATGTGFASASGLYSSAFGLFPAAVVGIALASLAQADAFAGTRWRAIAPLFPSLVVAFLLSYWRASIGKTDTRIDFGPYAGIHTTAEKATFLRSLSSDVAAVERPDRRILFLYHFPAGYLMTRMRPAASSVWTMTCTEGGWMDECIATMRQNLERYRKAGLVVVLVRSYPAEQGWVRAHGGFEELVRERFLLHVDRGEYAVYLP